MMSQFAREILSSNRPEWVAEIVRHDGKADTLLKQMRRKFGQTPDWAIEKVTTAEIEQIDVWSENVLFANSVDEVFAAS
ncbi:MAG: DUF4351 domain-containing protein [Magnetococcus sp. YQC-9]